nr:50S ribosomal protein L6P [uncultured archaeon]
MKKELFQEIDIPNEVEAKIDGNKLTVKGHEGKIEKKFNIGKLIFEKKENKIIIKYNKATKKEKRNMNSIAAHIKNMIKGVQKKFEYKLKICFSHFPITVDVQGNKAVIKNFLGEKIPRKSEIIEGSEIKVDKEFITVTSAEIELAGQTAANLENATKVGKRDRRVFQDGIFIINKHGKEI